MVFDFQLAEIDQLQPTTLFKEDDLKVAVAMLLGKIVMIGVRNIPHQKRRSTILKVVNGKLVYV